MSADHSISSNTFGPNNQIHQGDTIIHNYSSNASRKAYYVLPFPPNEDFIPRPKIIAQLDQLLLPSKDGQYCSAAIWGLGGSGKSQIALDYVYRRSREDPVCNIFWVHADNDTSFAQDYQEIARKLHLDPQLNGEKLFVAVRDCIESLERWLLILDNADDVTLFGVGVANQSKSLLRYIPRCPGGTVLWTSRDQQIIDLVGPTRGVQTAHMAIEEAEKLLSMARHETIRDDEIQDARLLLQELQWLPLAISQAGSFMRRIPTPIKKYLSKLLEGKSRWDMLKKTQHERHRRPDVSNSILETWNISIQHIRQESEIAYKVLHTIAYIDNRNIPLSVILKASATSDQPDQEKPSDFEEEVLETVIVRLKEFSFISERKAGNDDEPRFDMHKLVQDAVRYRLDTEDVTLETYFSSTALGIIASLFPEDIKPETLSWCEKYAAHAVRVSNWAELSEDATIMVHFLSRVSEFYSYIGAMKVAEYVAKKALNLSKSLSKRALDEDLSTILCLTTRLIRGYLRQWQYEDAERLAIECIEWTEKAFGEENVATVAIKSNLAIIYCYQGRYKEAEELQLKMLSLRQKIHGEKHFLTVSSMEHLAKTYKHQKRYDEAIELSVKTIALYSEALGEMHPRRLCQMGILGEMYTLVGQTKEAEALDFKLLSLAREFPWEQYTEESHFKSLASPYFRSSLLRKARDVQKRIVSSQLKHLGEKNHLTLRTMQMLAKAHAADKEYKEAEELQLKVLESLKENLGYENDETILALGATSILYYSQFKMQEGLRFDVKIELLLRKMYGGKRPARLRRELDLVSSVRTAAFMRQLLEVSAGNHSTWELLESLAYVWLTGWACQIFFILLLVSGSIVTTAS